jgi:hypothetical protein
MPVCLHNSLALCLVAADSYALHLLGAVLIEHAHWSGSAQDRAVAARWAAMQIKHLSPLPTQDELAQERQLAMVCAM